VDNVEHDSASKLAPELGASGQVTGAQLNSSACHASGSTIQQQTLHQQGI